jgi:hypothetical protein
MAGEKATPTGPDLMQVVESFDFLSWVAELIEIPMADKHLCNRRQFARNCLRSLAQH